MYILSLILFHSKKKIIKFILKNLYNQKQKRQKKSKLFSLSIQEHGISREKFNIKE
jgi:hypothetical protein